MLLRMKSLTELPKPSSRQYHSNRHYLWYGPPIHLTDAEARDPRWPGYENAVQNILHEPAIAPWLDGPLESDWTEDSHQQRNWSGRVEADHRVWGKTMKWKFDNWAIGGGVSFWITHITAALGFALIANTVSEANHHPTKPIETRWETLLTVPRSRLLIYWYLTTAIIVIQGVLARSYV